MNKYVLIEKKDLESLLYAASIFEGLARGSWTNLEPLEDSIRRAKYIIDSSREDDV